MYMTLKSKDQYEYIISFMDKQTKLEFGEIAIELFDDYYLITGKVNHFEIDANVQLFHSRIIKLCKLFDELKESFINGTLGLPLDRPVYIASDELISRDYIQINRLKRVPRYCGYYFI